MRKFRFLWIGGLALLSVGAFEACQDDDLTADDPAVEASAGGEGQQAVMLEAIVELNEISLDVLADEAVREEVYDLSMREVYKDRYVGLADLLDPAESAPYQGAEIRNVGAFKRAFEQRYAASEHPSLASYLKPPSNLNQRSDDGDGAFADKAKLYYYIPYAERYPRSPSPVAPFTTVPSQAEANEAPGWAPQPDGTYEEVMVDDEYAVAKATIIITPEDPQAVLPSSGSTNILEDPTPPRPPSPPPPPAPVTPPAYGNCAKTSALYTGRIQVTKQWDNLTSINGNGGGSEMKLGRMGSDKAVVGSDGKTVVASFSAEVGIDITRNSINDKTDRWWGVEFDPRWECTVDPEQRFVLYEWDNDATTKIGGALKVKVKLPGGAEAERSVDIFSVTIKTHDEIIWQQTYKRAEYFSGNRADRECGLIGVPSDAKSFFARTKYRKYACRYGYVTMPDVYF